MFLHHFPNPKTVHWVPIRWCLAIGCPSVAQGSIHLTEVFHFTTECPDIQVTLQNYNTYSWAPHSSADYGGKLYFKTKLNVIFPNSVSTPELKYAPFANLITKIIIR